MGYVHLSEEFVNGLNTWINLKRFKRDEIIEVFAGDGKLGNAINLPKENVTDDYSWAGFNESQDEDWISAAKVNVYETSEDAKETIKRFNRNEKQISLLIMGFPPDKDPSAYEAAKELNRSFKDALILYIGTDGFKSRIPIASDSFFDHIEDVDDEPVSINGTLENFDSLVRENYDQKINDEIICASIVKFIPCDDGEEKCSGVIENNNWCRQ